MLDQVFPDTVTKPCIGPASWVICRDADVPLPGIMVEVRVIAVGLQGSLVRGTQVGSHFGPAGGTKWNPETPLERTSSTLKCAILQARLLALWLVH